MKLLFLTLSFLSVQAYAKTLNCEVLINNELAWSDTVKTLVGEKMKIASIEGIVSYITEKPDDQFVVEAFLPQYEIRIYGQGALKSESDRVGTSLWGREMMMDIFCKSKVQKSN